MRTFVWMWLALSACEAAPPERVLSPLARERGRLLFRRHCALCHGPAADGHGARAFAFDRRPADFTSPTWRRRATAERVRRAIRDGVRGTPMPAWPSLSPDELDEVAGYVLSVAESGP
jgi:cytochrome c oxidase cbb3-type subunit I/II